MLPKRKWVPHNRCYRNNSRKGGAVTDQTRWEYAEVLRGRYTGASRREKGRILDEYCRTTGCHRKAAIRRLGGEARGGRRRPGRRRQYGPELLPVLERVWEASDYLCGKLLRPMIPTLLTALAAHHGLTVLPSVQAALVIASPATLDRLLRPGRRRRGRAPRRPPGPLNPLRAQVPLRTWADWQGVRPGALQGDLVLHCGTSTRGFYLTTLLAIDVATTWTEVQAIWGLHHRRVSSGVHLIRARLPFPLREWHCDNGSEFLNAHLLGWCRREGIRCTRGRPYRKNDQAWAEQRNWLAVRRVVGYDRFSSRAAFTVLQRLYALLRLQHNFFRPVRKLLSKQRVGGKVRKRYDAPQTPYQRLLATGLLTPAQRAQLDADLRPLDPIRLAHDIQCTLDVLWKLADTHHRPAPEVAHG
jgi:hypothetical protein